MVAPWTRALSAAAFVAITACAPGPAAHPVSRPAQPSAEAARATWLPYTSYAYGYTFKYPTQWFEVFGGLPGNVDFSTEKGAGSPLEMSPIGVFVDISPYCFGIESGDVLGETNLTVAQTTVTRKVIFFNPPASEKGYMATVRINVGPYCYQIEMIGLALPAIQANLADFDLMLTSLKFGERTAPIITPPGF